MGKVFFRDPAGDLINREIGEERSEKRGSLNSLESLD
jgi:hypothetical protein